jgi:hypothetical protein
MMARNTNAEIAVGAAFVARVAYFRIDIEDECDGQGVVLSRKRNKGSSVCFLG